MLERIIDIIVVILRQMKKNVQLKEINLSRLAKKGYTPSEISSAISWLEEKNSLIVKKSDSKNKVFRILHPVERSVFTSEAYGYLVELQELGIINEIEAELIIDKIMGSELMSVSLDNMKTIASNFILERRNFSNKSLNILSNNSDSIH